MDYIAELAKSLEGFDISGSNRRAIAVVEPLAKRLQNLPGMQLQPSKTNPGVRRWQQTAQHVPGQKQAGNSPESPDGSAGKGKGDTAERRRKLGMPGVSARKLAELKYHIQKTGNKNINLEAVEKHGTDQDVEHLIAYLRNEHHRDEAVSSIEKQAGSKGELAMEQSEKYGHYTPKQLGQKEPPLEERGHQAGGITREDCETFIKQHVPILTQSFEMLDELYGPQHVVGRIKTVKSLHEKMIGRWSHKQLKDASDVVGTRVTFDTVDEVRDAVRKLKEKHPEKIESIEDKIAEPKGDTNYRSIHVMLTVNGRPVEVQFRTPRQTKWADWSHETLYKDHSGIKIPPHAFDYAREVSDYFAALDEGQSDVKRPDCDDAIRQTVGCIGDTE